MPNFQIAVASRNLAMDAALDVLNGGGFLRIYSGAVPASADAALGAAVLLAELGLAAVAFAAAAAGSKAANAISQDPSANNNGVASFFRLYKSDGVTSVTQGLCGTTGSGEDLELNTTTIATGVAVQVTSFVPTFPV